MRTSTPLGPRYVLNALGCHDVGNVALVHGPAAEDERRGRREGVELRGDVLAEAEDVRRRVFLARTLHGDGGGRERCAARRPGDDGARGADGGQFRRGGARGREGRR